MKKALIISALLLLALFATNPSLSTHRDALLEKENAGLMESGLDASSPLIQADIAQTVERRIERRNYALFSLTIVNYSDTLPATSKLIKRTVGIGIFGKVYLWSQM